MDAVTLLVIILVVVLLFGGGSYWHGGRRWACTAAATSPARAHRDPRSDRARPAARGPRAL